MRQYGGNGATPLEGRVSAKERTPPPASICETSPSESPPLARQIFFGAGAWRERERHDLSFGVLAGGLMVG